MRETLVERFIMGNLSDAIKYTLLAENHIKGILHPQTENSKSNGQPKKHPIDNKIIMVTEKIY